MQGLFKRTSKHAGVDDRMIQAPLAATRTRVGAASERDDLQSAIGGLLLGGAWLGRLGSTEERPLLELVAGLERSFGEGAVDVALDESWGGELAGDADGWA
ncbi:MAG: hypothetical protein ACI9MC_002517 [Kiritimatiellia bacterium]